MNYYQYNQIGGTKCCLCGSDRTNKSTCPLNPASANPNAAKHPGALASNSKVITKSVTKTYKKPTKEEINEITNLMDNHVPEDMEYEGMGYWVDDLLVPDYILTMADLSNPELNDFYVIPPQTYDSLIKFSDLGIDPKDFYEYEGKAVSGSGADTWAVYRPELLNKMREIFYSRTKLHEREERARQEEGDEDYESN